MMTSLYYMKEYEWMFKINFPECDIIKGWWHHCITWKNMSEHSKWHHKDDDITVLHERMWVNIEMAYWQLNLKRF